MLEETTAPASATQAKPTLTVWGAYNPSDRGRSAGGEHLVLGSDFASGRLKRRARDPLCKPRGKFWGLGAKHGQPPTCTRCIDMAKRHGLVVPNMPAEVSP